MQRSSEDDSNPASRRATLTTDEDWSNLNRPNAVERAAMLARALTMLATARTALDDARRVVEPSGDRCALTSRGNYDYQRAIHAAEGSIQDAQDVLDVVIAEVVPRRCRPNDPPTTHIGPWAACAWDASKCLSCGAVYETDANDGGDDAAK